MSVGHFATKVDRSDEAHFPAKRSQEETEARLPRSDANARGTRDSESPACQGTDEAVGLRPAASGHATENLGVEARL
jgi:hypothetical protein